MTKVKYLVIGGGISGLTFCDLKKDDEYLVIEKNSTLGGLARTFRQDGFVWDIAGHFFHFHSKKTKEYYDNLMKFKEQKEAKKVAKVFYDDKYIDAPFQYNINELPDKDFIECLVDLYFSNSQNETNSFKDFVINAYGAGIANKFLIPYNEKLYACNLDSLEKESMREFLPKLNFQMLMEHYKGRKMSTYNDTFLYPINGCDEVIDSLFSNLNKNKVHLNEEIIKIDLKNHIASSNLDSYKYDYLINTSPLNSFCKMINKESKLLHSNKVLVLNLGFDKDSVDKKVSWAYFPGSEIFYRVGFYNNITGSKKLSLYVEIGFGENEPIDVEKALKITLNDLKKTNIIDDHILISYKSYVIDPAYVHITEEGKSFVKKLNDELLNCNVFMIGRYARWEYSAMDDSIEQAFELSEII